ncbi:MAG TPA: FecR domain-containing protein [Opitutus sp.]|nr:FecR domain-containing protein [Opitutus sp.]
MAQPEQQVLSDGSLMEFNPGTVFAVDFSDVQRRVVLQRGEAFFNVRPDSARPFVVVAGSVEFRAVGTAFAVQLRDAHVEVVVTEGRVAVNPFSAALDAENVPTVMPTLVDAGQRARVEDIGLDGSTATCRVEALSDAELVDAQGWRVPRLEFSGTPLAEALPLFNLHSSVQLVLDDPSLGRLRLSGIIRADNTDALLRLLESSLDITAERRSEGEIRLRRVR